MISGTLDDDAKGCAAVAVVALPAAAACALPTGIAA